MRKTVPLALLATLLLEVPVFAQAAPTEEYAPDKQTALLLHFNEGKGQPECATGNPVKVLTMNAGWSTEGKFGGALSLESGILGIEDKPSLRFSDRMTVEMWIRPTEEDCGKGYHILAHKRGSPGDKLYLVLRDGRLMNYPRIVGQSRLVGGAWYHVAYVVTGTKEQGGREYLFINGLLDAERPSEWVGVTEKVLLRFGGLNEKTERYRGLIDELRISNVARPYPGVPK
jgi:hypothetical protein